MMDNTQTGRVHCTWIPVTDAKGRTRMEARWIAEPTTARVPHAA